MNYYGPKTEEALIELYLKKITFLRKNYKALLPDVPEKDQPKEAQEISYNAWVRKNDLVQKIEKYCDIKEDFFDMFNIIERFEG